MRSVPPRRGVTLVSVWVGSPLSNLAPAVPLDALRDETGAGRDGHVATFAAKYAEQLDRWYYS